VSGSPPLPKLLTVKQAFVETLGLSLPMGYKAVREGLIPVVKIGSSVRIHPEDLAAFIEARRGKKTSNG
jgi:excisionase family DNA binding protein